MCPPCLQYEVGQFYRTHHDYIEHQEKRRCGPRVLTFFLYLSDVEIGGATNFPLLNIAVKPKVGRALLWPSVLSSDPYKKDPRTDHEAQNVLGGVKFGANAWLHVRSSAFSFFNSFIVCEITNMTECQLSISSCIAMLLPRSWDALKKAMLSGPLE